MSKIVIDIMIQNGSKFFATLRIEPEPSMVIGHYGNMPVISVCALSKVIEDRRPTLRGKDYRVIPCTDKYIFNYDYDIV